MPKRNSWVLWAGALALIVLFVWGLERVELAPIESGDVFPPYSSLRTDPLGTKALYDSLAQVEGVEVTRLYTRRARVGTGTAVIVMGLSPYSWSDITQKALTEYEDLLKEGGRLILAFLPVRAPSKTPEYRLLADRWDLRFKFRPNEDEYERSEEFPRDSAMYFDPGKDWTVVEESGGEPSAIERRFHSGKIVLLAESFPFSNEGLRDARDAQFIARVFGDARKIGFDEDHFGIEDTGSIAGLMRKYHLEPAIGALFVTVLLFLWRSSTSLLPPQQSIEDQTVTGRASQEGLISLLERSVPESALVETCYAEWRRTAPAHRRTNIVGAEISRASGRSPAEAYRAASKTLHQTEKNDRTTGTTASHA